MNEESTSIEHTIWSYRLPEQIGFYFWQQSPEHLICLVYLSETYEDKFYIYQVLMATFASGIYPIGRWYGPVQYPLDCSWKSK